MKRYRFTAVVLFLQPKDSKSSRKRMSVLVRCLDTPFLKAFMMLDGSDTDEAGIFQSLLAILINFSIID